MVATFKLKAFSLTNPSYRMQECYDILSSPNEIKQYNIFFFFWQVQHTD